MLRQLSCAFALALTAPALQSAQDPGATPDAGAVGAVQAQGPLPPASIRPVTFERILNADREPENWLTYSGTVLGRRHSLLTQITPENVRDLEIAWIWQGRQYQWGQGPDPGPPEHKFEATPLVADGLLFTVQPPNDVIALDATTGRIRWTYRHAIAAKPDEFCCGRVNRGLAILGDTLFMGTLDARLLAFRASTGEPIWNTEVASLDDPACRAKVEGGLRPYCYSITHAPLVVKNQVIVGTAGGDGGAIRGFIAAYDASTGRQVWRFHTIPASGEPGNETWLGESWKTGGAGVWNTGAYDAELNLTYWGTGNPCCRGQGTGDKLYSDSVVALDADTGRLRWHYQFTPNDERDIDAGQVPVLVDTDWLGRPRRLMLWANKNGLMYVLDRATGQLLMGKPFVEVNWMKGLDDRGRPITVPLKEGEAVRGPGGTNWFPPSYSPRTGLFYIPARLTSIDTGAVRAIDPTTGDLNWEFQLSRTTHTAGILTTATDLLFSGTQRYVRGATPQRPPDPVHLADGYFFAVNARSGQLLWSRSLGGDVRAGPMSYSVNGKQYVAVAAGNSLFAFALR
jgi:alcohol dehydrogenase (cytochrome c)